MKKFNIGLKEVQAVYDGPEGKLWELIMGEQIHIGGFAESMVLAEKAGIKADFKILDLCSALGAGLRFLVKNFGVQGYGLDASKKMFEEAQKRAVEEGLADKIEFKLGNVLEIPWPDESFDVVWGEDAWCYVDDKDKLIEGAARVLKKGGTLAFSDWIEGPNGLSDSEAERINTFMKFPYLDSQKGYNKLIEKHGLDIVSSEDLHEHFANCIDLYIKMLTMQLSYDALKIIGDDMKLFEVMGGEMMFMSEMAHAGKFGRGRWIAVKK